LFQTLTGLKQKEHLRKGALVEAQLVGVLKRSFQRGRDGFRAVRLTIFNSRRKEKNGTARRPSLPFIDEQQREMAIAGGQLDLLKNGDG
jgi:hypothetical protein